MKLSIIGAYPPPYGGISVHVKRVKKYMSNKCVEVEVYNESRGLINCNNVFPISSYKKFIFKVPFLKADIIHFHTISKKVRILLGFFKIFNKKIVLTIHGESLYNQLTQSNIISKKVLLFSMNKIDKIICVNSNTINQLISLGVSGKNLEHIPAYLNPIEDAYDFNNIPNEVWKFINCSEFLISANGCVRFYNNEDLYGFDMLLKLIEKLKKNGFKVNLIISVLDCESQNQDEKRYYEDIKKSILTKELSDNIFLFEVKDTEFYPILKKSNLFLRPTNTDGYGISIAEALYYKVPSIASDVCIRPNGTIIFKSRDMEDLYEKVIKVITDYDSYKEKIKNLIIEDNGEKLLNLYKDLVK